MTCKKWTDQREHSGSWTCCTICMTHQSKFDRVSALIRRAEEKEWVCGRLLG